MKIISAPVSFKGSLSSTEAARTIAAAVKHTLPDAEILEFPLSDGGEGFVAVLVGGSGGKDFEEEVCGPLPNQKVHAAWGILGDGETAVIEMAAAAGLSLVPREKRDPKVTTTFGVGQLIKAALDEGVRKVIIGLGGSATNDGGAGMAQALGAALLKKDGSEIGRGGASVQDLHQIDISWLDRRVRDTEFIVASDVTNPLCGPNGASAIYGPQKGATESDVNLLDKALERYAQLLKRDIGIDVLTMPGSGAAGGLGAGCVAFLNARIESGVEYLLKELKFDEKLRGASLVITGEGKVDEQTMFGKAITGVIQRAKSLGIQVIAIAGKIAGDTKTLEEQLGLEALYSLTEDQITEEEAMRNVRELLHQRVGEVLRKHVKP